MYHQRKIDTQKTLTMEQVQLLLDKSRGTKIGIMVLFNVLMGLRRSEIVAALFYVLLVPFMVFSNTAVVCDIESSIVAVCSYSNMLFQMVRKK